MPEPKIRIVDSDGVSVASVQGETSISVPDKSFDFNGGTGSFSVNDHCNKGWMIKSNCSWVFITSGNDSGSGNGTVPC